MMQNTSIIYHPESLTEMQLISLIIFWSLFSSMRSYESEEIKALIEESGELPQVTFLMSCLAVEHVAGYFIEFFR